MTGRPSCSPGSSVGGTLGNPTRFKRIPFRRETQGIRQGAKRSHLSACRKDSIEDYYTGLSRLQEQPAEAF